MKIKQSKLAGKTWGKYYGITLSAIMSNFENVWCIYSNCIFLYSCGINSSKANLPIT